MEKVLELQGDGVASPWSWASPGHVTFSAPLAALTFCLHVLAPLLRPSGTLISLATNTTDNYLTVDVKGGGMTLSIGGVWTTTCTVIHPGLWTSLCLAYSPSHAAWTLYIDGRDLDSGNLRDAEGRVPPQQKPIQSGWVVVGQDQDRPGGGYQTDQSFRGRVARLRLWGRRLRPQEVAGVARCDASLDGETLLTWPEAATWRLNDTARVVEVPRQDICRPTGPYLTLLSPQMSFTRAWHLCTALGSHVATPISMAETEAFLSLERQAGDSCGIGEDGPLLWLGASDEGHEGRWVDEEGRGLAYANWIPGQPNGMVMEDRAVMTRAGTWMDVSSTSSYYYCAICSTRSGMPLMVRLRGLCPGLQHDTRYIHEGHVLAKPFFRGFTVSNISWDGRRWLAMHQDSPGVVLSFTPEDPREMPLGRRAWEVAGAGACGDAGGRLTLALTACTPGNFTCDDGSCVPADMRCDFQADCEDGSDERECETVILPATYKSNIPPRSPTPTTPTTPTATTPAAHPVSLHVTVLSLEIVTEKMEIVMDFDASLRWTDPRLVFRNLKLDLAINALRPHDLMRLWVPQVSFSNAKGNAHTLLDGETRGVVLRWGEARQGDATRAWEVDFFSGADNPIQASRKYSAIYRCSLDLTLYPFDTQECSFVFLLTSARRERLQLVQEGEGVTYTASTQLLEYSIVAVTALPANHSRHSALQVTVRFCRRFGFAILTVYTPSCFFVIIAYLTTFYPLSNLQVRVVIALTAMLVLTTLLSQVSANLPRNSYFKALDVWMFGAIGLIFSILILQTVADVLARAEADAGTAKVAPQEGGKSLVSGGLVHVRPPVCQSAQPPVTAPRLMRGMQVGYPAVTLALVVAYVAYVMTALR